MSLKHLQTFYNKSAKGTAAENLCFVKEGWLYISDIETGIRMPTDLPDGKGIIRGGEYFTVTPLDGKESFPFTVHEKMEKVMKLSPDNVELLNHMFECSADDELRPYLNSVQLTHNQITATNAHLVRIEKFPTPENVEMLIPKTIKPLLSKMLAFVKRAKSVPDKTCQLSRRGKTLKLEWQDIEIYTQEVQGNFPNVPSVMPTGTTMVKHYIMCDAAELIKALKDAQVFANKKDAAIRIYPDKAVVLNDENENIIKKELNFAAVTTDIQPNPAKTIVMPVMVTKEENLVCAFSSLQITNIMAGIKSGTVIMGFAEESNAIQVWLPTQPMAPAKVVKAAKETVKQEKPEATPAPIEVVEAPEPTEVVEAEVMDEKPPSSTTETKPEVPEQLVLVDYSERAVAVFGPTKPILEKLKEHFGRFNPNLMYNGEPTPGWIFSAKRKDALLQLIS